MLLLLRLEKFASLRWREFFWKIKKWSSDILAGTGPLGFGEPRLCVQVKSQDTPVELKEIKALKGAMQDSQATQGLFVSWGGYKSSIKEQSSFFSVRLWGKNELLAALFQTYEKLDPELRADLPLKQIWTLTDEE